MSSDANILLRYGITKMLPDDELDAIERRVSASTPGPWRAMVEGRDHTSGGSFIRTGEEPDRGPDIYATLDGSPAGTSDLDFIAAARTDIPLLIEEVRRLRMSA